MKKQFFAKHAKSSAALVSVVIHALFIVVALSFVAVSVIQKDEVDFEATQIKRPKMNLRKLQVPVKKVRQQPRLRKQIVVKPNVAKITPDIKMPEIVGVRSRSKFTGGTLLPKPFGWIRVPSNGSQNGLQEMLLCSSSSLPRLLLVRRR